jgi:hypothetical protein
MSFSDPHIRPVMKGRVHKKYLFTAFIYNDIAKRIRKQTNQGTCIMQETRLDLCISGIPSDCISLR